MNRHLKHYKLGTLCSVKHGYPFDGSKFADHGTYIVLTPGNFLKKSANKKSRVNLQKKEKKGVIEKGYNKTDHHRSAGLEEKTSSV